MLQKDIAIDRRGLLKVGALTLGSTAFAFSPWGGCPSTLILLSERN